MEDNHPQEQHVVVGRDGHGGHLDYHGGRGGHTGYHGGRGGHDSQRAGFHRLTQLRET